MRFNERELALYGSNHGGRSGRIDREGYLWKRGERQREGAAVRVYVCVCVRVYMCVSVC